VTFKTEETLEAWSEEVRKIRTNDRKKVGALTVAMTKRERLATIAERACGAERELERLSATIVRRRMKVKVKSVQPSPARSAQTTDQTEKGEAS
jgi:hypothetical protein